MYKQLQRSIAVFLLFSFFLQSCIPAVPISCATQPKMLLTKPCKNTTLAGSTTANHHTNISLVANQPMQVFPNLESIQNDFSRRFFTAFSGEQVRFFQENGFWKAKIHDPWLKISTSQDLPVFFQLEKHSLQTLNILANPNTNIHKHRIHVLHTPTGKSPSKYIFVGSLGLLGGMQAPQESNQELQNALTLHAAVKHGNLRLVEQLLATSVDPNIVEQDRSAPLHWAAAQGYLAIVDLLLAKHADPNIADRDENTPLHWAAEQGHLAIIKQLLDNNADPNIADRDGNTPLHWAAEQGHLAIVKQLLDNNADPNIADRDGNAPLHWAAEQGHLAIVKQLLDNNADPNIADRNGNTPLHWAAEQGHLAIVKQLLDNNADPNIVGFHGNTPLHKATEQGHLHVVKLLLDSHANPNLVDQNDITPLHWASTKSYLAIVSQLLDNNANPNIADRSYGYTPLHRAAISGCLEIIVLLLQSGASHSQADKDGNTPLHWATSRGHLAVVRLLLAKRANLNVTTSICGYTPLHFAANQGSFEIISMLLQAGAKANTQDIDGNTFLHGIVAQRNLDLLVKVIKLSNLLWLSDLKKCIHTIYPKVQEDPKDLLPIIVDYAQAVDWDLKNKQGQSMLDLINIADLIRIQPQAQPILAGDANTIRKIIIDRVLLEPSLKN
jgi:ankyrin repeat protein